MLAPEPRAYGVSFEPTNASSASPAAERRTMRYRLTLVRRMGSVDLDLTRARFAGPIVVIELDLKFGSLDLRLPDGASASIDDVEVIVGSARDHRVTQPPEGRPHVVLTGKVTWGSVDIRGPRRTRLGRRIAERALRRLN